VNQNLFAAIPVDLPDEFTTVLEEGHGIRIERIVSQGHSSPAGFWYDQPEDEWVLVLKGAARLEFKDRMVEMLPVDTMFIPAHQKHRVAWTSQNEPTIWLTVHFQKAGMSPGGKPPAETDLFPK